ncbi:hypothetical protein CRUP_030359 [Coryphaenoides rupestris]|nr:hypothetical protein CRUP_030359 [Coryphaenoides rupestris]
MPLGEGGRETEPGSAAPGLQPGPLGRPAAKPAGRPAASPQMRDCGRDQPGRERSRGQAGLQRLRRGGRTPGKPPSARKMNQPRWVLPDRSFPLLRTWKLQQQQGEEEKRRQEEEEQRSKREEEIRKIRDLSNQDEQYKRFMKLVGGKAQAPSTESLPPKPPLADEEEEEEMLLRETCLMSMVNKRAPTPEDEMPTSGPPSPKPLAPVGVQLPPRGNLSMLNQNTAPQARPPKFSRGHHGPRAPLMLPRHRPVVVQLHDSDDSESDTDACSSTQPTFGCLDLMIKEARRTVEAAKPKVAAAEKENNPLKTPEALPEAKKTEYRMLREEIMSREKQRQQKEASHSPHGSGSPAVSDTEPDASSKASAELQVSAAQKRLTKHRWGSGFKLYTIM